MFLWFQEKFSSGMNKTKNPTSERSWRPCTWWQQHGVQEHRGSRGKFHSFLTKVIFDAQGGGDLHQGLLHACTACLPSRVASTAGSFSPDPSSQKVNCDKRLLKTLFSYGTMKSASIFCKQNFLIWEASKKR